MTLSTDRYQILLYNICLSKSVGIPTAYILRPTSTYKFNRLPMAERVGFGAPCLLGSLGVREVVGSRPGRGNSKESCSSYQETGKVFSPENSIPNSKKI